MLRKKIKSLLCRIPLLRRFVPGGTCDKNSGKTEATSSAPPSSPVAPPARPTAAPAVDAPTAAAPVAAAPAGESVVSRKTTSLPESPAAEVQPAAKTSPAHPVAETTKSSSAPEAPAAKGTVDEAKVKKHREKTKKAVLKQLIKLGGTATLADLHDFSEKKYFVAHRAFSSLMEEYVEENLLLWDATTGIATITDAGRSFVKG